MLKKFCDKCQKEIKNHNCPYINLYSSMSCLCIDIQKHLCAHCYKKLKKFLDER